MVVGVDAGKGGMQTHNQLAQNLPATPLSALSLRFTNQNHILFAHFV